MTAITYRRPAQPLEVLMRTADGILLRVSADAYHGHRDRAPGRGRNVRKLVRALVAYKQAKRK